MVKYREIIFILLILFFLFFSFSPTLFELSKSNQLKDPNREFILEHNYYWPDFNLYLSKIRQGYEGRLTALERYTSEPHRGSLLQEFYVVLGFIGKMMNIDPNFSYQLGRIVLSPLLLFVIMMLSMAYFRSFRWQILAFLIVVVSSSFPRFYTDQLGVLHVGRFMEWWSNIDALQRITFIPHILFGQVVSFYLLYKITDNRQQITNNKLFLYIILGNLVGLVFPPSLITLNSVIILTIILSLIKNLKLKIKNDNLKFKIFNFDLSFCLPAGKAGTLPFAFCIFTLPSLLYLFIITKSLPWSALVDFHRTHPMLIPFGEYIKGTGPIFYLGLAGAVTSIINRDRKFQPLILWLLVTFFFAIVFTHVKEQSPLRFTQTGLFIPLGILGAYFFRELFRFTHLSNLPRRQADLGYLGDLLGNITVILVFLYVLGSLYMMKISLTWQTTWISQRIGANIPLVPYPPQTMYPLKNWMDGIRWLANNADHNHDIVLAQITAGNYIPAYGGNTVYFGQSNTVDYDRKQLLVDRFFKGEMGLQEAKNFLAQGKVRYIFVSYQEKEMANKDITKIYNFLLPVYNNSMVNIYTYQ